MFKSIADAMMRSNIVIKFPVTALCLVNVVIVRSSMLSITLTRFIRERYQLCRGIKVETATHTGPSTITTTTTHPHTTPTPPLSYLLPKDRNQCWNTVNWTFRSKLRWQSKRNSYIHAFEKVVCEMPDILHFVNMLTLVWLIYTMLLYFFVKIK